MSRSRNKLSMLSDGHWDLSEKYRSLRFQMEQICGMDSKILAIVAPIEDCGTTETASNLAVAYARAGHRTLLVDGDMRRPTLHRLFGVPNVNGLSAQLGEKCEDKEAIHYDVLPNLSILTAGYSSVTHDSLNMSSSLRRLREGWNKEFDKVIVDVPPMLASANAQELVSVSDGTLLVLRRRAVNEVDAVRVKRMLDAIGVPVWGTVLTYRKRKRLL